MSLTPSTVIDWRRELVDWLPSTASQAIHGIDWDKGLLHRTTGLTPRQWTAHLQQTIRQSDCYLVNPDMHQLAKTAGTSLTEIPRFLPSDLPSTEGLIVYPDPIIDDSAADEIIGVAWLTYNGKTEVNGTMPGGVLLLHLNDRTKLEPEEQPYMPAIIPTSATVLPFADIPIMMGPAPAGDIGDQDAAARLMRVVAATWLLMGQRLATKQPQKIDRPAARRATRAQTATNISVITLRRLAYGASGDGDHHDYTCQWLVRGHWRQQWHPSRNEHRPVWIAPYIKGPEDKPFRTTERVYAWTR